MDLANIGCDAASFEDPVKLTESGALLLSPSSSHLNTIKKKKSRKKSTQDILEYNSDGNNKCFEKRYIIKNPNWGDHLKVHDKTTTKRRG